MTDHAAVPSACPLAEVASAFCSQFGENLIIFVTGYTSGYGGSLQVWRSPLAVEPPVFVVFAIPGNDGINPGESPRHVLTQTAVAFVGRHRTVEIESNTGRVTVPVRHMEVSQPATGGSEARTDKPPQAHHPGWWAVRDLQPDGSSLLVVRGWLVMPTPGWVLTLVKAVPQGWNPRILLLDLVETRPTSPVPEVLTLTEVRPYREETKARYSHVHIRTLGVVIEVESVS